MIKQYIGFFISGLTVLIFFLTKNPITGSYKLHLALVMVIVFAYLAWNAKKKRTFSLLSTQFLLLGISCLLFLVAATGWFLSPFFYLLYLLPIALSYIFSEKVAYIFVMTLVVLFGVTIGQIDVLYDALVIISLLTVIPLIQFLKKQYPQLKSS